MMQVGTQNGILGLTAQVKQAWRQRFNRWIVRRIPPARQVVLGHHNIFIIPNQQGLGFMLVLGLMFIGAVNYESNLSFALVFLLVGMFVLSIFHTFRNLSGLHLSAVPGASVFAGEMVEVTVILRREGERRYESIELAFPASRKQSVELSKATEARMGLYVPAARRGYLDPGRLVVETVFPFGICRAWSLVDFQLQCLVYPKPQECDLDWLLTNQLQSGNTTLVRGSDDFHSLREYRVGDPLKHVAWKNYARGQGMLIKEYASTMDQRVWLRWDMFPELDVESRLSRLCWCVLRLDEVGLDYGLDIPGTLIQPAKGQQHYQSALEALALFGLQRRT
jgi:uncharacterized protein (DUF58 family)